MKNKLKSILALLLVAVMALSVVGCDFDTDFIDQTGEVVKTTQNEDEDEDEDNVTFSVDVSEQTSGIWKMTYKECQIKDELDSFTIAEEGSEFVVVFFEIENISEESQNFSLIFEEFYFDGVKTAQSVYGSLINSSFQLTAIPVEPGRKANGYFLFQTTPNWKELEIIYHESLIYDDEDNPMKFILTKNVK